MGGGQGVGVGAGSAGEACVVDEDVDGTVGYGDWGEGGGEV